MDSPYLSGNVLLRSTTRPLFAWIAVVLGFLMMFMVGLAFATNTHDPGSSPASDLLLFMVGMVAFASGIYRFINPLVLFEATRDGIMLYANSREVWQASRSIVEDLFIPWERVELIYFLTRQQVIRAGLSSMSSYRGNSPLVVFRIRRDFNWPPFSALRPPSYRTRNARPDEIYLNADEGTVRGIHLYDKLEELRAVFTGRPSAEVPPPPRQSLAPMLDAMMRPKMIMAFIACLLMAMALKALAGIIFFRLWWLWVPALVIYAAARWIRKRFVFY